MLRTLSTGKVFTTLDLRGAYNLLRIRKGDEPKTSFITKYGQFEFLVMPFGLANAPAQFQRMMNSLFRESEWQCHFYQTEIKYLGYIISSSGVSMDPSKIKAVQEWPAPRKLFKKDTLFIWGPEQQTSFENLKTAFANSTLLLHPDDSRPFILETDASDYGYFRDT
ncbi:hypothetical protein BASA83_012740 [Batrachochytrium salamandrivorans]|nr:hypothetical protein BASA83_012740 [Batrachochytrium salamandrivorans]